MKKLLALIKKYWLFILLGTLAVVAFFLRTNSDQIQPTPTPTPTSTLNYQNIQPGITSDSQLKNILGSPQDKTQQQTLTILKYSSTYPTDPHIAIIKNDLNVLFIEKSPLRAQKNISKYTDQFGLTTNIKYLKYLGPAYSLHLYLDQGVAFGTHTNTGEIVETWYFQPQSLQQLELISPFPFLSAPPQFHSH